MRYGIKSWPYLSCECCGPDLISTMADVLLATDFWLVLCEYSKFRIESNSYLNIRFDSKPTQLFEIFKYLSLVHNDVLATITMTTVANNATNCHCFGWLVTENCHRFGQPYSSFSVTIVAGPENYSESLFRATMVAENGDKLSVWERQKLFDLIQNFE